MDNVGEDIQIDITIKVINQPSNEASCTCPICGESINEIHEQSKCVMATLCGHIFCNVCILTWLEFNPESECPICRQYIKFVHPLYSLQ